MAKSSGSLVQLVGVRWRLRGDQLEVTRDDAPRCETCRWWKDASSVPDLKERWGRCNRATIDHSFKLLQSSSGIAAEEAGSGVRTRMNFGCVQWEGKEDGQCTE